MKWTWNKPKKRGNYWYRRDIVSEPGQKKEPRILYVNSDLCVPQLNLFEYREPVSVNEYHGQWAGPISEPDDSDKSQKDTNVSDTADDKIQKEILLNR